MNIKERLSISVARQKSLAEQLNAIEESKQDVIKEIFRLEGEIRVLKEMELNE